jgi:hypothetical protein
MPHSLQLLTVRIPFIWTPLRVFMGLLPCKLRTRRTQVLRLQSTSPVQEHVQYDLLPDNQYLYTKISRVIKHARTSKSRTKIANAI